MPELRATRQSPILSPLTHTCLSHPCSPILQESLSIRGAAQMLPKHQNSQGSGQPAPLAMGVCHDTGL